MNDTKTSINDTKNMIPEQPKTTHNPPIKKRRLNNNFRYFDQKKHTLVCVTLLFYVCVYVYESK